MKALDPGSVVREGEQDQARATGGVADRLVGYVNQIKGEGALPEDVFNEMVLTAKRLANEAITEANREVDSFLLPFEDRLPEKFVRQTKKRKSGLFEMTDTSATAPKIKAIRIK